MSKTANLKETVTMASSRGIDSATDKTSSGVMTKYTCHPLMLICPRKIDSKRTFAIDISSTEPAYIVEDPLLVWALTALPESFTRAEATAVWKREPRAAELADEIWEYVSSERLVLTLEAAEPLRRRCKLWEKIGGPEAGIYHEGTRDYPFVDMSRKDAFLADNQRMKDYEQKWAAPGVYQSFPALRTIPLEKVTENFAQYLQARQEPDNLKDLSLIFDFCFGERIRLEHAFDEQEFLQLESLRKTIPSGGGRHPTEVFMAVFARARALGLEPGLYHYNVQTNVLELLRAGDFYEEVQSLLPAPMSTDSQRPQALMFFTSLCERAMWRYRDPRSWRAFIIDVGHAEYMCAEVCAALGLTLKFCHGISSQPLAEFLSVDPFRQPIMSVATLSTACGAVEDKE